VNCVTFIEACIRRTKSGVPPQFYLLARPGGLLFGFGSQLSDALLSIDGPFENSGLG
jgi:hypothetical protein